LGTFQSNDVPWAQFILNNGGAVLLATDQGLVPLWDFNSFANSRGLAFDGQPVIAFDDAPRYRGLESCPFLIPLTPEDVPGADLDGAEIWKVFRGLDRVAANRGTFLRVPRFNNEFRYPLARYHKDCVIGQNFNRRAGDAAWFAVGGEAVFPKVNPYRLLVLGDHSVFINQMFVDADLDNRDLDYRVVEYLKDPKGVNRKYCIFIENGRTLTRFDEAAYALQPPTVIPPFSVDKSKLIDIGNKLIDNMQSNDVLNRMIFRGDADQQDRQLRRLVAVLLVMASAYMTYQLLHRMMKVRHPLDAPLPPVTGRPTTPDPANPAGIFDRRQRELLRRDNVYEPVRDILRDMFAAAGAPPDVGPKLPKVVVVDTVRKPETLQKALADLWKIAHGPPKRLTVKRWGDLEPLFVRARRAFDDGKWSFAA
jgi:hypothetical protein